ncbi:MAG: creatininase family protein [Butyrivibrio sp.]
MNNNELLKLTAHQVKENKYDKAILSIGSCEAHGQHIAEGCDTIVSYEISKRIADKVKGLLVIPPVTVGYSKHYDTFPFTLSLEYETTIRVIYDYLASVLRNGINKIFIMNGHDGNIAPIEVASRQIKENFPEAKIVTLPQWWVTAVELLPEGTFEAWNGSGHAGEGETSIAYYLFPQWCEPELATCVIPDKLPKYVDVKWDFSELTNTAQTGDATVATAKKGEMMTNALVNAMAEVIEELDKTDWNYNTTLK